MSETMAMLFVRGRSGWWNLSRRGAAVRCVAHHGPVPGEEVVVGFGGHRIAWHVTDDRIPVCEGLAW